MGNIGENPYKKELVSLTSSHFKTSALQKTMLREWKDYKKIFAEHISGKVLVFRICKELSKLNSKKATQ